MGFVLQLTNRETNWKTKHDHSKTGLEAFSERT